MKMRAPPKSQSAFEKVSDTGRGRLVTVKRRVSDKTRGRGYLFSVAQIFNLPYRRFVIGRTLVAGDIWQVKNLRYSTARRSRNQTLPLLHRMASRRMVFARRRRTNLLWLATSFLIASG